VVYLAPEETRRNHQSRSFYPFSTDVELPPGFMPNETKGHIGKDWRFIKKLEEYLRGNEMSSEPDHIPPSASLAPPPTPQQEDMKLVLTPTSPSPPMLRHDPPPLLHPIRALPCPLEPIPSHPPQNHKYFRYLQLCPFLRGGLSS